MANNDIYAVVWSDFVPLHLKFNSAQEAIDYAYPMRERLAAKGMFMDVRAVHLTHEDKLIDLIPRELAPETLKVVTLRGNVS